MTNTLTETKPTEPGWYWFIGNGKSPKHLRGYVAEVVRVRQWVLYKSNIHGGNLCAEFTQVRSLVTEMGGLWSERIEEPEKTKDGE